MLPLIEPDPVGGATATAESDAVHQQRDVFRQAMRDYLATAGQGGYDEVRRARSRVLDEYLELEFLLHGGTRCALCAMAVRHPKSVTAVDRDGGSANYPCLCLRCLMATAAESRSVIQRVGPVLYEYYSPSPCRISWRQRGTAA